MWTCDMDTTAGETPSWSELMLATRRCSRCIMPEVPGHLDLDEDGICPCCRQFEQTNSTKDACDGSRDSSSRRDEAMLRKKIDRFRTDGPYDCAVAVSGGKDSLGVWHLARKLGLKTLGIFIDNGFALPEMYENIQRAADVLDSDVMVYRTTRMKRLFRTLLASRKPIYYCHVCHILLDNCVKDVARSQGIGLVLGGYTKGQNYLRQGELDWIFRITDRNLADVLAGDESFADVVQMVCDPFHYALEHYRGITELSPYRYLDYDEDEIVALVKNELHFEEPTDSWPARSTNCLFNYVSQYLAVRQFGYSQHETELSDLTRAGEMSREHALETICTPIEDEQLAQALAFLEDEHALTFLKDEMESALDQKAAPSNTDDTSRRNG
ncbi:MAG: phosphoadenosine phosphosulfate reductase family protein [Coriobacteriales bacterium]